MPKNNTKSGEIAGWWDSLVVRSPCGEVAEWWGRRVVRSPWWDRRWWDRRWWGVRSPNYNKPIVLSGRRSFALLWVICSDGPKHISADISVEVSVIRTEISVCRDYKEMSFWPKPTQNGFSLLFFFKLKFTIFFVWPILCLFIFKLLEYLFESIQERVKKVGDNFFFH